MSAQRYIAWNLEFCTGCRLCELACSSRFGNGFSPSRSAIHVQEAAICVCRQCRDPQCETACKQNAIDIGIDPAKCSGCGACVSACPHQSIFQPAKKTVPFKCDLCGGRPECVRICPNGALSLARKGRMAACFRSIASGYKRLKNEAQLVLKTKANDALMLMTRNRIVRLRRGRKDSLFNRVVLTPMVKPFEKNFFSRKDDR
ncbi:MAG: 4Fe-4S dicluster domain-containing protein [Deltaproteobacteria bacterium]|nr:4Fe-4S dicluster domain-containing protein [Deltaproteobacteria bacterium]